MKKRTESGSASVLAVERLTVYGADWCRLVPGRAPEPEDAGIGWYQPHLRQSRSGQIRQHSRPTTSRGQAARIPLLVWPDNSFLVEPSDDQLSGHSMRQAEA